MLDVAAICHARWWWHYFFIADAACPCHIPPYYYCPFSRWRDYADIIIDPDHFTHADAPTLIHFVLRLFVAMLLDAADARWFAMPDTLRRPWLSRPRRYHRTRLSPILIHVFFAVSIIFRHAIYEPRYDFTRCRRDDPCATITMRDTPMPRALLFYYYLPITIIFHHYFTIPRTAHYTGHYYYYYYYYYLLYYMLLLTIIIVILLTYFYVLLYTLIYIYMLIYISHAIYDLLRCYGHYCRQLCCECLYMLYYMLFYYAICLCHTNACRQAYCYAIFAYAMLIYILYTMSIHYMSQMFYIHAIYICLLCLLNASLLRPQIHPCDDAMPIRIIFIYLFEAWRAINYYFFFYIYCLRCVLIYYATWIFFAPRHTDATIMHNARHYY